MTIVVHQVMNNLTCIFRYEIKDDTPIETKLEDKLIISETSTSLKASNKEEESADAAEQNRLNEKQAQGMFDNDILSNCVKQLVYILVEIDHKLMSCLFV